LRGRVVPWFPLIKMGWAETATTLALRMGVRLDLHVPLQDKALAVVRAERAVFNNKEESVKYAGAAILMLALAIGGRGRAVTSKLIALVMSFAWASLGLSTLGAMVDAQPAGAEGWPVEGVATAVVMGLHSAVVVTMGVSGLLSFQIPCTRFVSNHAHQVGAGLMVAAYVALSVHNGTKGRFFAMAFPLDVFTIGFVLASAVDSGYSKLLLHVPIMCALARSLFDVAVLSDFEHSPIPVLVLIGFQISQQWGRASDPYRWVAPHLRPDAPGGPQQRQRRQKPKVDQPPPLMQDVREGEGGIQGMDAVKHLMVEDEDGDEAMEFFDVTDQGLRRRDPSGASKQAAAE